ncbi:MULTISPECIES: aminoacyl-tRNA hydrolase [Cetobacterium]|jgi:PTH1 family peptidyl-tRNA hydrolase|uniref:Peptidyl-tRNA hydrolase n=1 Tax=Candidatus Cetobacterium colombiensis TaxID=3073100 RepID=A0ABU4WD32_9FUSO|nr:aminoacyl-tRNA hydrolase [Candidatus Cetobacterium colombiensis]MDX8337070.1 aminoacyl-tRNA hydrolase [Candidatus Cetobacterium colombiensis]
MKLIVGLGNPGKEYDRTRHNVGFDIIDEFAEKKGFNSFKEKFQGLITEKTIDGEKVILLKPQTYMNLSGNSIVQVVKFYKIDVANDLVVVYDDMDLPLGKIRVKTNGSAGGHNGIKSIISHLGQDFVRVKCGIGKAKNKDENINFVLGRFTKEESEIVNPMFITVSDLLDDVLKNTQTDKIMQKYNKK